MELVIVGLIVALCAFYWLERLFPSFARLIWKGIAQFLKILHAPNSIQQRALKHCIKPSLNGVCSGCKKCNGNCG